MKHQNIVHIDRVLKSIDRMKSNATLLVKGRSIPEKDMFSGRLQTELFNWYHGEGQVLSNFKSYKRIGAYMEDWFKAYEYFYTMYMKKDRQSIFLSAKKKQKKLEEFYSIIEKNTSILENLFEKLKQEFIESYSSDEDENSGKPESATREIPVPPAENISPSDHTPEQIQNSTITAGENNTQASGQTDTHVPPAENIPPSDHTPEQIQDSTITAGDKDVQESVQHHQPTGEESNDNSKEKGPDNKSNGDFDLDEEIRRILS